MFVDDAFMEEHFPPRIVFSNDDELRQHKSRLITQAQLLRDTSRNELSIVLFQQAAGIELRLAELAVEDANAPSKNNHLVSAASCFVLSGDLLAAVALLPALTLSSEAKAFFARIPRLREAGAKNAQALVEAFHANSLDGVRAAAARSWGTVPVRVIYWPLLRLASRASFPEDAKEALRRLVIAYPMALPFHLLYLSSSAVPDASEAIEHALALTKAFPTTLAAHVALATALVRAGNYAAAIPACERALQLVRVHPGASHDPNSMVSMAFANASIALRRAGRRHDGLRILIEAVQRLPRDPLIRTLYALALVGEGDEQRAGAEASNAADQIDEEGDSKQIHSHWPHTIAGVLALRRGDYEEAVRRLDTACRKSRGMALARNLNDLGVALVGLGDRANAEAAFGAAVAAVEPNLEVSVRNLARIKTGHNGTEVATSQDDMEDDLFRVYNHQAVEEQQLAA